MNKEQALSRLTSLENEAKELRKIIEMPETPPTPKAEERFWQLCEGLELKIDKVRYHDTTFFFKGDECWFEYEKKTGYLWCRYKHIWSVFENEYAMNYNDIQSLIKNQVESHFKCKGVTPFWIGEIKYNTVESHFKCKGVTPENKKY